MEERVLRDRLQQLLAGLPTETGFQGLAGQYEDVLDELGGGPAPPDLRCAALVHGGLAALHEGGDDMAARLEEVLAGADAETVRRFRALLEQRVVPSRPAPAGRPGA